MEFFRILFLVAYFGTPLFIVYSWIRLARLRTRKAVPFRQAAQAFQILDETSEQALQVVLDFSEG